MTRDGAGHADGGPELQRDILLKAFLLTTGLLMHTVCCCIISRAGWEIKNDMLLKKTNQRTDDMMQPDVKQKAITTRFALCFVFLLHHSDCSVGKPLQSANTGDFFLSIWKISASRTSTRVGIREESALSWTGKNRTGNQTGKKI